MPKLHIMVIEDDRHILEFLDDFLTMEGYIVSRCMTGEQAVEQVVEREPHLVLLDHSLIPGPNGWEILQELHRLAGTIHIPVILFSARHDILIEHADEIHAMGGDVLKKPFDPVDLLTMIETLTRNRMKQEVS